MCNNYENLKAQYPRWILNFIKKGYIVSILAY